MNVTYTADQILALAPDAGSATSGKALAVPRKWSSLGRDDRAVWGECQGSGAKPYQPRSIWASQLLSARAPAANFPASMRLVCFFC